MNILILIFSLGACLSAGLPGFMWLLTASVLTWLLGLAIPKRKNLMWVGVIIHTLLLTAMKLSGILRLNFPTPLGFSYVTLVLIGYCIDVRNEKYPPEKNLFRFLLCITYYPKLAMGPIENYGTLAPAMTSGRSRICWDSISSGAARMLWGLFKQLVIAARAGTVIAAITADPETFRGAYALAAVLLYSVRLYADFSGGMDLVLGFSRILGISLSENFDRPYFSQSVAEFWRRWHMTLGAWLKNYVYIPLGGNRKGTVRKYCNTIITFLVSGFWHGTEYLLWGLFNGIFVCFGDRLKTRWKTLNRVLTFLLITLLWSFFVWPDAGTALTMVGSIFTAFNYGAFFAGIGELGLNIGEWLAFFGGLAVLWICDIFRDSIREKFRRACPAARLAVIGGLALVVLIFGMYGIGFVADEFIYSRF